MTVPTDRAGAAGARAFLRGWSCPARPRSFSLLGWSFFYRAVIVGTRSSRTRVCQGWEGGAEEEPSPYDKGGGGGGTGYSKNTETHAAFTDRSASLPYYAAFRGSLSVTYGNQNV